MILWLLLDAEDYTPASETIDPEFVNKLGIHNIFWKNSILISLSETGRLHDKVFKGVLRHCVSLYRLRHYRRESQLNGINLEKIHAFLDAPTASLLLEHVDILYVIRVNDKHHWRYGRFEELSLFRMLDATAWHYHCGQQIRIERWFKSSK